MADVSQIKLPNGSVYDLIDEKSGYITAEYIENKTDYEIPVSRVGEIVVGETAIGTDSTNFPTSKAVVDYVDERVVQEIDAIDVGVTGIQANGTSLSVVDGVVNIPAIGPGQSVGLMTEEYMLQIYIQIRTTRNQIPTSTSQLTNDSGFITASDIPTTDLSGYMQKGVDYVTAGQKSGTTLGTKATAEGSGTTASGSYSHAEGYYTTASGSNSHVEGYFTIASGSNSHVEGYYTTASGSNSHVEGFKATASKNGSHAEGIETAASGNGSHAEGYSTVASGYYSHSEGYGTTASGSNSHTEGKGAYYTVNISGSMGSTTYGVNNLVQIFDLSYLTNAYLCYNEEKPVKITDYTVDSNNYISLIKTESTLDASNKIENRNAQLQLNQAYNYDHVQGIGNLAYNDDTNPQHVAGKYNSPIAGAEVIGGGTSNDARLNIRVLDWSGNETLAGKLTLGADPTAAMDAVTKQYLEAQGFVKTNDIASVLTYKGTKASSSALPSSGNTTGDVWHLTDTGAEWAWDGSAWQELGTAIDLSNYATKATTLAGYGITDAKIENGTITLGSNTITPLTSFTETDPTVPSWAKASTKPSYGLTEISGTDDLRAIEALTGTSGLLKKTAANTWTLDTNTYLTSYTETDPTVPSWAKASTKPTYTAAEVGALPDTTTIPSKTSDLTNDSGFITSYTDEKLGLSLASSPVYYYPILTLDTTTAGKKSYDNDGFQYYNYSGTTSAVGNAKLTLGNNKTATTAKNKQGTLELYGSTAYATRITAGAPTVIRNIEFPNKDGTVALTSDIPTVPTKVSDLTNDSGFISSYTETDPVFAASAAAGITSTDISNWNGKSSTDEKLKTISGSSATQYYPIFGNATSTAETKRYSNNFRVTDYNSELELQIGQVSSNPTKGTIKLVSNQAQGYVLLRTVATSGKTITLPDKDGTIALTSDIPSVYSSTNTGGYLTMATLPIYDGTVE